MKKIARYILGREAVVWIFRWQDEEGDSHVYTDSDWGGTSRDRRSTSGGIWLIGSYAIKAWSLTQGAVALSSAEA